MDGDQSGDQGADGGARDDLGQQAAQEQGLDDAEVAHAEDGAALQDQARAAKGLAGVVDEGHFGLHGQGRRRQIGAGSRDAGRDDSPWGPGGLGLVGCGLPARLLIDGGAGRSRGGSSTTKVPARGRRGDGSGEEVVDGEDDLGDVLVDDELGAGEGAVVQLGGRDVAQVADEAGADEVGQAVVLGRVGAGVVQQLQAVLDKGPVVVLGLGRLAPEVEAVQLVELQRRGLPVLVRGRVAQPGHPHGLGRLGPPPAEELLQPALVQ